MSLHQIVLQAGAFSFPTQPIFQALDLTLNLKQPVRIGLRGANGAGKTTLIKIITGQLALQAGSIQWFNADNQAMERSQAMARMGVSMADRFFMQHQTLRENLDLYARFTHVPANTIEDWLSRMKLDHHQHTAFDQLSTGQRKKASLIRAFMHQPDILFLDEPLSGLDIQSQEIVTTALAKHPGAWLVASHYESWLETHCSHQWHLHQGVIDGS